MDSRKRASPNVRSQKVEILARSRECAVSVILKIADRCAPVSRRYHWLRDQRIHPYKRRSQVRSTWVLGLSPHLPSQPVTGAAPMMGDGYNLDVWAVNAVDDAKRKIGQQKSSSSFNVDLIPRWRRMNLAHCP